MHTYTIQYRYTDELPDSIVEVIILAASPKDAIEYLENETRKTVEILSLQLHTKPEIIYRGYV